MVAVSYKGSQKSGATREAKLLLWQKGFPSLYYTQCPANIHNMYQPWHLLYILSIVYLFMIFISKIYIQKFTFSIGKNIEPRASHILSKRSSTELPFILKNKTGSHISFWSKRYSKACKHGMSCFFMYSNLYLLTCNNVNLFIYSRATMYICSNTVMSSSSATLSITLQTLNSRLNFLQLHVL